MANAIRSANNVDNTKQINGKPQVHRAHGDRIIRVINFNGRNYMLHATKGWRSRRT
jgi:hypothetical protein